MKWDSHLRWQCVLCVNSGNSPLLGRAASALAGLSLLCLHLVLRVLLHLVLRVRVAALGAAFCLCLAGRFLLCCEVSRDTGHLCLATGPPPRWRGFSSFGVSANSPLLGRAWPPRWRGDRERKIHEGSSLSRSVLAAALGLGSRAWQGTFWSLLCVSAPT